MPQEQGVKKKASHIILTVLLNNANPNLNYEKTWFSFLSCLPRRAIRGLSPLLQSPTTY